MLNTIFLAVGILILLIFILNLSIIHIRSVRDDLENKWYLIAEKLQHRQDILPNLIETARLKIPAEQIDTHKDLMERTIKTRVAAAKNIKPGSDKIVQENELSDKITELLKLGEIYESLGKSTNYLELKKDFKDLHAEIDELTKDYNNRVRTYNSMIVRPYNFPAALLMKYKKKNIFSV